MHVALTSLLGCLVGAVIVAALVWDWWAHPDLTGPPRYRPGATASSAAQGFPATAPSTSVMPALLTTAEQHVPTSPAAAPDRRRLQPVSA